MAIITIYQGASGSGEEIAEAVAEVLGYGCISREVLVEASLRYGIPETKLSEIVDKEPNWWNRFVQNLQPYRMALQAAFCELAQDENIVYHGHLGHELLPDLPHVLKVLLTAPMAARIEQIRARHKLNEAAARRYIEELDKARTRRLMGMFGTDWKDPSRFDLVVNLGRMSVAAAKQVIVQTVGLADYQMTPAAQQAFANFSLMTRVHAVLVLSPEMATATLDIKADEGNVSIAGVIPNWVSEEEVVRKVKKVGGVRSVSADLVNSPPDLGLNN